MTIVMPGTDSDGGRDALARLRRQLGEPWEHEFTEVQPDRVEAEFSTLPGQPVTVDPGPEETLVRMDPAGALRFLSRPLPLWKRSTDVLIAAFGLALLSPLLAMIAIAVKLSSRGPALFRQVRTGRDLVPFQILKFRTMRTDSDRDRAKLAHLNEMSGPLFKSDTDPRVTPLGRHLRRASLDELPQLWNVLRGDMTLLGPRALSPKPSEYQSWHLRRFVVTPGVACTWQATHRGETDFDAWMRSDLAYIDKGDSVRSDIVLFGRALWAVATLAGGR